MLVRLIFLNGTAHHSNGKFLDSAPHVKLISCMQPKTKIRKHLIPLVMFTRQVKLSRYFNFIPSHDIFFLPLSDRINNVYARLT